MMYTCSANVIQPSAPFVWLLSLFSGVTLNDFFVIK